MLKIYGVYKSRATRTYWMVRELDIAYEQVPVIQARRLADPHAPDAPINTHSPAFLAVNPMGTIPSIEDDGITLHQSMAINLYLARKHGGPLAPANLIEDARMEQWSFFAATEVETNALKISFAAAEGRLDTEGGRMEVLAAARLLARPFAVMEKHFFENDYVVGGRFTAADINLAEVVRYASPHTPLMEAHPHTRAWLKRCQDRPAFQAMWATRAAEAD